MHFIVGRYKRNGDVVLAFLAQEAARAVLAAADGGAAAPPRLVARISRRSWRAWPGARPRRHGRLIALTDCSSGS